MTNDRNNAHVDHPEDMSTLVVTHAENGPKSFCGQWFIDTSHSELLASCV